MKEQFDDVVKDFIGFVNQQAGVYIDALAGFAGNCREIELQVHRAQRPSKVHIKPNQPPTIVWTSYEDPTQPDIIHDRIIRTDDYLAANASGGSNEQQHARAILIFLYTYWELEIRPRLAAAKSVELEDVCADVMGDLRIIRNVILHANGIVRADKHKDLKKLGDLFCIDQPIVLPSEDMKKIFERVQQDCARLIFDWLGVGKNAPIRPEEIVSFAIQKARPRSE